MKLVRLDEFLEMPKGVVFMKYQPDMFYGLAIKGDSLDNGPEYCGDFFYTDMIDSIKGCRMQVEDLARDVEMGYDASFPLDFDGFCRDGCFEPGQLFAVYEKTDLDGLIDKLKTCVGGESSGNLTR